MHGLKLPRPTIAGGTSALSSLLATLSNKIKGFEKIDPSPKQTDSGDEDSNVSPRREMLRRI
jgi:hypothetical protein